ncbi:VOC family protein [Sphingomonas sp. AOB5]|uniref:VOC family protein n=1 Tax=Sphingomonas sp. AOB5 TaxID=3034017 RepID=UPI0023F792C8|nr:VOC family protein [Sphingomonas sp. AOB5]MDF7776079.1 VOC family protein [Sphingomonas sp. AOB5]
MAILGVESAIFGVDDLDRCTTFWEDFGLTLKSRDADESVFELPSGSKIVVRRRGDPRLPAFYSAKVGVHETIWGVDTQEALDTLIADLKTDREVTVDPDGTAHFACDDGSPIGLRLWAKKQVVSQPDPVNAPGNIQRLNVMRKWRPRALPKTINHIVFFAHDYVASLEFYINRLGFRYVDHSRGAGAFARADGTNEHHSIFWVSTALPVAPDEPGFMHIAFGLEDIDELMIGVNYMEKKGWKNQSVNSSGGLSRHRISSAIYYYFDNPSGGEAEYHVDTDYLDDQWVPRVWDWKFGSLMWATTIPSFWAGEVEWDMKFDADRSSLEPFRRPPNAQVKPPAGKLPDGLEGLTSEDEHAI